MLVAPRHVIDIGWRELVDCFIAASRRNAALEPDIARAWRGAGHVLTCLSVRTAFDALLRALELPAGSEIVMSAINIAAMGEIARAHGLIIRRADVNPDTLAPDVDAVEAAVTDRTRLILIAHLFGARVDLAPFARLRAPDRLLVEDAAQAWTPSFRGSPEADISLFSFGPIKTATALGGAVAVFHDAALANRVDAVLSSYSALSNGWFARRVAKYAALKLASSPLIYGAIVCAIRANGGDVERAVGGVARGFPSGEILAQIRQRPPDTLLRLLHRRLIAYGGVEARRRAALDVLERLPVSMRLGEHASTHDYWVTPVLAKDPDAAREALLRAGFDATRGATSLRVIDGVGATPGADALLRHALYLPSPAALSARQRRALADTLLKL